MENQHKKRIAAITYAQERWRACISLIIAHARGRRKRINSSWERVVRFVLVRKGGRKGSWGGGWNWLGRAGFEIIFGEGGGGRQREEGKRRLRGEEGNRDSWTELLTPFFFTHHFSWRSGRCYFGERRGGGYRWWGKEVIRLLRNNR